MVEKTNANQPAGFITVTIVSIHDLGEYKTNHIKHNPNCIRAGRKSSNHIIYIITNSNRNLIVFKIEM
jgi:hypothetical protein